MFRLGNGYKGSSSLMNSGEGNFQVVPPSPDKWTVGYNFYKFEFMTKIAGEVTVKINNEEPILLSNGHFSIDYIDSPIWSFIVIDPNVDFYWYGAY